MGRGRRVSQVTASAGVRTGEQGKVYAMEGGVARKRAVALGHRNGLAAEVVSGVKEGERVIPHPDESVVDGKMVVVKG